MTEPVATNGAAVRREARSAIDAIKPVKRVLSILWRAFARHRIRPGNFGRTECVAGQSLVRVNPRGRNWFRVGGSSGTELPLAGVKLVVPLAGADNFDQGGIGLWRRARAYSVPVLKTPGNLYLATSSEPILASTRVA
jgi:hypothetical protein